MQIESLIDPRWNQLELLWCLGHVLLRTALLCYALCGCALLCDPGCFFPQIQDVLLDALVLFSEAVKQQHTIPVPLQQLSLSELRTGPKRRSEALKGSHSSHTRASWTFSKPCVCGRISTSDLQHAHRLIQRDSMRRSGLEITSCPK